MIGSDKAASEFIEKISEVSAARSVDDYADLLLRKRRDDPGAEQVLPWDVAFLEDLLKSETLAFDTQAARPYFEFTRVRAGLMALVERMFGIDFRPAADVPVWHPEVEVFDAVWADSGAPLGRIFLDLHPRADKYQHAAMFGMRTGNPSRGRLPECALLCNFPKPGATPALLQHSDVTTFFHEFGHLIHHLIGGHQRWSGISGIENERDFVEAPSQLLEEWTFDAGTLAEFACHYETGEPLPAEMVGSCGRRRVQGHAGAPADVLRALSLELFRRDPEGLDRPRSTGKP
jgi:thimet oligopeptidase